MGTTPPAPRAPHQPPCQVQLCLGSQTATYPFLADCSAWTEGLAQAKAAPGFPIFLDSPGDQYWTCETHY